MPIVDSAAIQAGPSLPPTQRIKLYSPAEWEDLVNEWLDVLDAYQRVHHTGGAGDMGRDAIALADESNGTWDNYQCKHYNHPLAPKDAWLELGKLCYYTFIGEYSVPRRYFFVAPQGVGTALQKLLGDSGALKAGLIKNWDRYCASKITTKQRIEIDGALLNHVNGLDFSIFDYVSPIKLIQGHAKSRFHVIRFGGDLPFRPVAPHPPEQVTAAENRYVAQLFEAYADHLQVSVQTRDGLPNQLAKHFDRARESFYCAEALRNFSRDNLPEGAFERLQRQIHRGVVDICESEHPSGFIRINETTKQAAVLALTHALAGRMETDDRHGICHQLANDDLLVWVPQDVRKS